MDYAIQLLLPVLGGLMLGCWLTANYGVSPIWTVVLAILGMVGGIAILYRRFTPAKRYKTLEKKDSNQKTQTTGLPLEKLDFLYKEMDSLPPDSHDDEFDQDTPNDR